MTQIEEVLHVLNDAPHGLTSGDVHARTGVPKNVLGTYLWELKRDGYVVRIGGPRGSYRYGLTERGRDRIGAGSDPLRHLAYQLPPGNGARRGVEDFDETLKVIDQLGAYRALKQFTEWLAAEHPGLFADPPTAAVSLQRRVLEHLGVDPSSYRKQSRALIELLDFIKDVEGA